MSDPDVVEVTRSQRLNPPATSHLVLTPEACPDWQDWPTVKEMSEEWGVTIRRVQQLFQEQGLVKYMGPDREWRYDPAAVEAVSKQRQQSLEEQAGLVKRQNGEALSIPGQVLKHSISKLDEILKVTLGPSAVMLNSLRQTCEDQRAYIDRLQLTIERMREREDKILNAEHERVLAQAKFDRREDRIDAAVNLLLEEGPALLSRVSTKAGEENLAAGMALLRSLNAEHVKVLLSAPILDEKQKALLRTVLESIDAAKAAAEKKQTANGHHKEAVPCNDQPLVTPSNQ